MSESDVTLNYDLKFGEKKKCFSPLVVSLLLLLLSAALKWNYIILIGTLIGILDIVGLCRTHL